MILDRLKKDVVLGDGGMIFELERRGYVRAGPYTPEVVVEDPQVVRQLHIDFARAGADVIQACTYYAHEEKLKDIGMQGALAEINQAATRLAREVADEYGILVAGNLCNTWVYDPEDPATHAETRRQFDEQIECQGLERTDFYIAETIEYLGEAKIALEAIKAAGQTAMITLGFKYQDKAGTGRGLQRILLKAGEAGKARVLVKGRGEHLPDPPLPLTLPITAQLRSTSGECWEAVYFEAGVSRNEPGRFKGKAGLP